MDFRTLNPVCDRRGCWQHVDCDEVFDGSEVRCGCGALNVVTEWHGGSMTLVLAHPQDRSRWLPLAKRRKPSKRLAATLRIERRAAEIAAPLIGIVPLHFSQTERHGMDKAEHLGWLRSLVGIRGSASHPFTTPRTPAEWSGWLAREIWSES